MKKIVIIAPLVVLVIFFAATACNQLGNHNGQMKKDTSITVYSSTTEAALRAKSDLLRVLRMSKSVDLGISDTSSLAAAVPGPEIRHFVVGFEKLLAADSTASLAALVNDERNTIVPLVHKKQVVTVVALRQQENKWIVASLAGKSITHYLNTLTSIVGNDTSMTNTNIILYEVANLNAKIFVVSSGKRMLIFTDYNSFSIRQPVSEPTLISSLKQSALRFQQKFGDQVKQQKLVE